MKLISYALWGDDPNYNHGAITNLLDSRKYYPTWQSRFYCFGDPPAMGELEKLGAEVIRLEPIRRNGNGSEDWAALLTRLWPMSEPGIERVIFRDTDCRFTTKEEAAVQAWIDSKMDVHAFYKEDRIQPKWVSGGMWGIKGGVIKNIRYRIQRWLDSSGIAFWHKGDAPDELFIQQNLKSDLESKTLYHGGGYLDFPAYVTDRREEIMGEKVSAEGQRILIWFRHGLGDAVQFTSVLRHLNQFNPDWTIDVCSLEGKHTAFHGLCRDTLTPATRKRHDSEYDQIFRLEWEECRGIRTNHPSTKTTDCLTNIFQVPLVRELLHYRVNVGEAAKQRAADYVKFSLPRGKGFVLLHYQGNTSQALKNLTHEEAMTVCEGIIEAGFTPVVLDWDRRCTFIDNKRIFCPDRDNPLWKHTGTGDAESLAALADLSTLNIGIDSGPQKIFMSRRIPCLCVWKMHHPIHYSDYCENAFHLVPDGHERHLRGNRDAGLKFFRENYVHATYKDLAKDLSVLAQRILRGNVVIQRPMTKNELVEARTSDGTLFYVREDNREQDLCVIQDVYEKDSYRLKEVTFNPDVIVDIGAHIGAFTVLAQKLFPEVIVAAVEACPENILPLRKSVVSSRTGVMPVACTYEKSPLILLNSVFPNCESTGGSIVCPKEFLANCREEGYWIDTRPLPTITLEQIMGHMETKKIDILKLDCEGSEFSILTFASAECLKKTRLIMGEWHNNPDKGGIHYGNFKDLVQSRFHGWDFRILQENGNFGSFWLTNPDWTG